MEVWQVYGQLKPKSYLRYRQVGRSLRVVLIREENNTDSNEVFIYVLEESDW